MGRCQEKPDPRDWVVGKLDATWCTMLFAGRGKDPRRDWGRLDSLRIDSQPRVVNIVMG